MADDADELRIRNAILEHQQRCPQKESIEASANRLRALNGIDKTVDHHEVTLYDEERGLVLRTTWLEENVGTMKPKIESLDRMHLKVGGAVAVIMALFSVLGWIGLDRLLKAMNAMAAGGP